ncbi:MAG TPA: porin [Kofleriaceae bacterium]|nr:porin [Kofleriaceae bacterium]
MRNRPFAASHLTWLFAAFVAAPVTASAQPAPAPTSDPVTPTEDPIASPEPVVAPAPPPTDAKPDKKLGTTGYDKGFFIKSGDGAFGIKLTGRIQPFYTMTRTDAPKDYRSAFEIRRARIGLDGNLHGKALTYKFQTDLGKGFVTLKDFHFDLAMAKDVYLRVGQWKRPFSRQQITSSGRQELTDRAITDRAFGAGRDIGLALRNDYEKSPAFEWTVGVFNGTGDGAKLGGTATVDPMTGAGTVTGGSFSNVPAKFRPVVVARAGLNSGEIKGYSEADLEGGPLRFGVAASIALEGDYDDDDKSNQKVQLDYIAKVSGLSTTGGVYAMTDQEADGDGVADAETSLVGFHVQAGYMLDKRWQAAARYALVNDPRTKAVVAKDQQEISVGANFFGYGHDAKFAGAVRFIKTGDASFTDVVLVELGANVGW